MVKKVLINVYIVGFIRLHTWTKDQCKWNVWSWSTVFNVTVTVRKW